MAAELPRRYLVALIGAAAIACGCGGDERSDARERLERVEKRYEKLWNAESVSCREAPGQEGYECRIVSKQTRPGNPSSSYDVIVPPGGSRGEP